VSGRRRVFDPSVPDGVDRELRFHLEMRTAELVDRGWTREDAEREARRRFGDVTDVSRELVALETGQRRSARRVAAVRGLWRDIRHGARLLARRPGFAAVAVVTLALGIGANTAIYSVLNAVLLRPLQYADPDRLVLLWESEPTRSDRSLVRPAVFMDWKERATSFTGLAAYRNDFGVALTGDGDAAQVEWAPVTVDLFGLLGVRPVLGRLFEPEEAEPGRSGVVLMSHALWQGRYGGDPEILGRTVELDGATFEVVGVLPPNVSIPSRETDFWSPLVLGPNQRSERSAHMYAVVGRLAPEVSAARAQAEMGEIAEALRREYAEQEAWTVRLVGLREDLVRNAHSPLLLLFGAVGLVLLVACANVSNLLLARGVGREREVAVRSALGAGRWKLVRQFLAESLVLAIAGGAAAVLVAWTLVRLLIRMAPDGIPLMDEAGLDAGVLLFTVAVVLVATMLFGIVPAMRASRSHVERTLSESRSRGAGRRQARLRRALVVAEVAISLVLLAGSGLLVRSLGRLGSMDPGYDTSNVLAAWISLPAARYGDAAAQLAFWDELLTRVRALPGVISAAGTSEPPVIGYEMTRTYSVAGRPDAFSGLRDDYPYRAVTDDFFSTMGLPVIRGRGPTAEDRRDGRGVVVVNEAMARLAWPTEDALGQRLSFGSDGRTYDVVGVVANARHSGLEAVEGPAVYAPYVQKDWPWLSWMTLMMRTTGDPLALADPLRNSIRAIDPDLPIQRLSTVEDLFSETLSVRRFTTALLGAFAALAVVLGVIGLYGVLAWSIAERRREFGVRLALGAGRGRVLADVLAEGAAVAGAGILLGLLAAFALRGAIRGLLFELQPLDPATLVGASIGLLLTCLLATLVPAMRAMNVRPSAALRTE
jgi:putative ABC transport system permease protein